MLRNPPFIGDFPITQLFGENPDRYNKFVCDSVALRGHNGIDFGTPPGTPVIAVQDGIVLAVREDPTGFGKFVLLGHEWGQSLYAHLAEQQVAQGQSVVGGQTIGLSGSTGMITGPHLHFGLRINPWSAGDGWCGYSDPKPYLDRLTQPRGAIIGAHIIGGVSRHLELLRRWQPRLLLVLDPNRDEMAALRQACPDTTIIGRIFAPDHEVESRIRNDPQDAARWAHDLVMGRGAPQVNYWQIANEILQREDGLPLLNAFELARMELAEAHGYRCAILAFSVGNPDLPENDRMAMWRTVYPAIEHAETNGHVVALHQYGAPDLFSPAQDWYAFRLEHQVLRRLPYKKVQFAITEYGIDGLIDGRPQPTGWQAFTSAEGYIDQLLRAGRYLERFSGRVLGYTLFTLGHNAPWASYDIDGSAAALLAERCERGAWSQVQTTDSNIIPGESDESTNPGGGEVQPAEPDQPVEPDEPDKPIGPDSSPVEQRISDWFAHYNMAVRSFEQRPDQPGGDTVYIVKDIFTTHSGSFDPSAEPGSIPQWARDAYLSPDFLEAGADHHLFARVLGLDGQPVKNHAVVYWSDGFDRLGDPSYNGYVREQTKESSGWANLFMGASSSYAPERGESGPWCWAPSGAADVVCGGGLPGGRPISTFVVWQAVKRSELEPEEPVVPEKPVEPEEPVKPPVISRRIGDWITAFNVQIKALEERPDQPTGDIVYLIKDIFTTRDGSWEPSDRPGSVNQWARDAYLKPFGAPDYFDDAGADHHLFAAVIGLDGQLMRDKECIFWSDGFEQLGVPGYAGYVSRLTKTHSGWANIVTGPSSNFVPERGESGPWCWAPTGAAEVVCGGGMPAKQHVSFFVVWQAVRREDLEEPKPDGGDFNIFLPFVAGGQPARQADLPPAIAAPMPDPLAAVTLTIVRAAAWNRLGLEYRPDSSLADYARRNALGHPLTQEFTVGNIIAQGFAGGIVFAASDDRTHVRHMSW